MHEENVRGRAVWFNGRRFGMQTGCADDGKLSIGRLQSLLDQPSAAGCREARGDSVKWRPAPIIVIARDTIQGRFNPREDFEGFREVLRLFDQVAGEANEFRRDGVDFSNDRLQIGSVTLVVDISEVHKPMSRLAVSETDFANSDPAWLKPLGIGHCHKWASEQSRCQESAAAEFASFYNKFVHLTANAPDQLSHFVLTKLEFALGRNLGL